MITVVFFLVYTLLIYYFRSQIAFKLPFINGEITLNTISNKNKLLSMVLFIISFCYYSFEKMTFTTTDKKEFTLSLSINDIQDILKNECSLTVFLDEHIVVENYNTSYFKKEFNLDENIIENSISGNIIFSTKIENNIFIIEDVICNIECEYSTKKQRILKTLIKLVKVHTSNDHYNIGLKDLIKNKLSIKTTVRLVENHQIKEFDIISFVKLFPQREITSSLVLMKNENKNKIPVGVFNYF